MADRAPVIRELDQVMGTTITLDDDVVAEAQALTGLTKMSALLQEALKALIARESARRLALLGGTQPDLEAPPRRRSEPEQSVEIDRAQ